MSESQTRLERAIVPAAAALQHREPPPHGRSPPATDGRTRTRLSRTATSRDSLLRASRAGPQPPAAWRLAGSIISVRLEQWSPSARRLAARTAVIFTRLTPCARAQRAAAVRFALRPAFSSSRRCAGRVPCYESAADRPVDGRSADGAREGGPARARRVCVGDPAPGGARRLRDQPPHGSRTGREAHAPTDRRPRRKALPADARGRARRGGGARVPQRVPDSGLVRHRARGNSRSGRRLWAW